MEHSRPYSFLIYTLRGDRMNSQNRNNQRNNRSRQPTKSQTNGRANQSANPGVFGSNMSQNNNNNKKSQSSPQKMPRQRGKENKGSLANTYLSTGNLKMSSGNRGTTRRTQTITEDEYIGEIPGSVAFSTTSYPINPGQSSTFPWGSKIAALYEKYCFNYLEFYYRREVSEFNANGAQGKVLLSCDYDASDNPPTSKQQVEDTEPHVDGMPCTDTIVLRLDPKQLWHQDSCYVRPGAQPANTDIKTYDCGNLYVSTQGCVNTSDIGELRVRYQCVLLVPVLENAISTPTIGQTTTISWSSLASAATTVYQNPLIGTPTVSNNIQGLTVNTTTGSITLPLGFQFGIQIFSTVRNSAADLTAQSFSIGTLAVQGTGSYQEFTGTSVSGTLANKVFQLSASIPWNCGAGLSELYYPFYIFVADSYTGGTAFDSGGIIITALGAV